MLNPNVPNVQMTIQEPVNYKDLLLIVLLDILLTTEVVKLA
jgi:hypothetical protein